MGTRDAENSYPLRRIRLADGLVTRWFDFSDALEADDLETTL
jgi:hypothetical protein